MVAGGPGWTGPGRGGTGAGSLSRGGSGMPSSARICGDMLIHPGQGSSRVWSQAW
jgi:hypothetical protein